MPRPRKVVVPPALTSGQAAFVVERLLRDRRVSPKEVSGYLAAMAAEIWDLETRLALLRSAAGATLGAPTVGRGPSRPRGRGPARAPKTPSNREVLPSGISAVAHVRKRRRITPAQRAARQLQGRYIGYLRQVPVTRRGLYQQVYAEQGVDAAIAALRADLRK